MWQKLSDFFGLVFTRKEQTLNKTHHKKERLPLQGREEGVKDHSHLLHHPQKSID